RAYRAADHGPCRGLWADLVTHQRHLHGQTGARDAGAGFEEYLTRLNLSGLWVAQHSADPAAVGAIIGLVGLVIDGADAVVDPVVVAPKWRHQGTGRALLDRVVAEARSRGLRRVMISPSVRDEEALRCLHGAGFDTVASVTLAHDLGGRRAGT